MNQGNRKQGKIVSIGVSSPQVGQQVWHPRSFGVSKITAILEPIPDLIGSLILMVEIKSGYCTVAVRLENLKQLVVKYEYIDSKLLSTCEYLGPVETRQHSLKYSQWSKAIENGEVDNDEKPVWFELVIPVCKSTECGTPACFKQCTNIAKVIPQRADKKMYSEEEVKELCMKSALYFLEVEDIAFKFNAWWSKNKQL